MEALESLYDLTWRIAQSIVGPKGFPACGVEDLVQEAMLRVLINLPHYNASRASRNTFLSPHIRGAIRDALRRASNGYRPTQGRKRLLHFHSLLPTDMAAGPLPEHRMSRREDIRQHLEGLTPTSRLIVLLRYEQGLSYRQIGHVCGLSESRVCQKMKTIHEDLRRQIVDREHQCLLQEIDYENCNDSIERGLVGRRRPRRKIVALTEGQVCRRAQRHHNPQN